jgi:hypothetical protein
VMSGVRLGSSPADDDVRRVLQHVRPPAPPRASRGNAARSLRRSAGRSRE